MSTAKKENVITKWRQSEESLWKFQTSEQFDSVRDRFCAATDAITERCFNAQKNDVADYKNKWLAAVDRLSRKQFPTAQAALQALADDPSVSDSRRLAMEAVRLLDENGCPPQHATSKTIWFHGERQYSIDGKTPFKVSEDFDNILQAFLNSQAAMETKDIEKKAGITNPSRTLKELAEWNNCVFKSAIRIPRGKAKGGYFIRVTRVDIP